MRRDGLGSRKTWACERKSIRGRVRHDGGVVRFWVSRQGRLVAPELRSHPRAGIERQRSIFGQAQGRTFPQNLDDVVF